MRRKVIQLLPTIAYGDAVSNDALAMSDVLAGMGLENEIFAINIDQKIASRASHISKLKSDTDDVIIFHMSTGSQLSQFVKDLPNKTKVMVYHNITPASYFHKYNNTLYELCNSGREQLAALNDTFELSLAVSEFNKKELEVLGYKNVHILPIILKFDDYKIDPDKKTLEKYRDDYINILFVGRIAPNKKQEDIIKSFYMYKKYINPKSRLFLIGSHSGMERYVQALSQLVNDLELQDVYLPGHTSFKEILAYYKLASVFLCMSEHEGFCVPLIESMSFNVPIIAYEAAAIPETLAHSGIVFKEKKYEVIAELIDMIVNNKELREKVVTAQTERLKAFDAKKIRCQFEEYLRKII